MKPAFGVTMGTGVKISPAYTRTSDEQAQLAVLISVPGLAADKRHGPDNIEPVGLTVL